MSIVLDNSKLVAEFCSQDSLGQGEPTCYVSEFALTFLLDCQSEISNLVTNAYSVLSPKYAPR